MIVSYAPQVIADDSGRWVGNGLRFRTYFEAYDWAVDRKRRWALVREIRVIGTDDKPNYAWQDGALLPVVLA